MKYLHFIVIFLVTSIAYAAPMQPFGSKTNNQNFDIRLSDNNVTVNYDFRIPNQKVFLYNQVSYNEKTPQKVLNATSGIIVREPVSMGFLLSLGVTANYLNVPDDSAQGFYLSIFGAAQDMSTAPNSLYYKVQGSISPNIITFGDLSNVYDVNTEIGMHVTYGAVIFVGYKYLHVKSTDISDTDLLSFPYLGMSLKF